MFVLVRSVALGVKSNFLLSRLKKPPIVALVLSLFMGFGGTAPTRAKCDAHPTAFVSRQRSGSFASKTTIPSAVSVMTFAAVIGLWDE